MFAADFDYGGILPSDNTGTTTLKADELSLVKNL
jgi:hypothetical protein